MNLDSDHHPWKELRPFLRHSLVLMTAGIVYVLIGLAFFMLQPTPNRAAMMQYALNVMSYSNWGIVFMLAGLLSVVSSRWPPVSETWGYFVLTGLSSGWAAFYLAGILFGSSPWANLAGVLTWALIAFMWWAISGLVNPDALKALANQVVALQQENLELHREIERLNSRKG